jgi:hypothetical protein
VKFTDDVTRYAIIRAYIWRNGQVGYQLERGKMYTQKARAEKAFEKMRLDWDNAAKQGRINPVWLGKFEEYGHRLIEVPAGQSIREAVNELEPDKIYYAGLAA